MTDTGKSLLETDAPQLQALGWNEHFQAQVNVLRDAEDSCRPALWRESLALNEPD